MIVTETDVIAIAATLVAILMLGSRHLQLNLALYSLQTLIISVETIMRGVLTREPHLFQVAVAIAVIKGIAVPIFLSRIMKKIEVENDSGTMMPAPLAMHLSVILLGASYLLSSRLPTDAVLGQTTASAAAALSLLLTGFLLMLTRRVALSQIIGFLTMENGIFLFAVTQTRGMPLMVEMGILLDVLAGVMITGLLLFRIKRSFEHIDVTRLSELKD